METNHLSVHRVNMQMLELRRECTIRLAQGFREIPVYDYCLDARTEVAVSFIKDGFRSRPVQGHTLPACPCDSRQVCAGKLHFQFTEITE